MEASCQKSMVVNGEFFARDKDFWNNYLKGRPQVPDVFFDRIFRYHQEHGGNFGTVHDVGAGNGPYSRQLRSRFQHVIISDLVSKNVQLAKDRLGADGFSYRTAKVEEVDDIPAGSVDMVFATNVLHLVEQKPAMEAIARQLRPGGTFACGCFGPAHFNDAKVQDVWTRMSQQGGRVLLRKADPLLETINAMARSQDSPNVAPLDEKFFLSGATRVNLNMEKGGLVGLLPPEESDKATEPDHTGPNDIVTFENEDGWSFVTDLYGIKEHFGSFPFAIDDPAAFTELWKEMEDLLPGERKVDGCWPAKVILATRC